MSKNFTIILLLICAYVQAQKESIHITGEIENPISKSIAINKLDKNSVVTATLNQGRFTIETQTPSGFYTLRHGSESTTIYLNSGDQLHIKLDGNQFMESLEFKGQGAEKNNYLTEKSKIDREASKDLEAHYAGTPQQYLKRVDALQSKIIKMRNTRTLEPDFIKDEDAALGYERLYDMFTYPRTMDFYFGKKVALPDAFKAVFESFDFDDASLFDQQPYYRYLASAKWEKDLKNAKNSKAMQVVFNEIQSINIKIAMLIDSYYSISTEPEKAEDYFTLIKNNTPNKTFVANAREKLKIVNTLSPGKPSPDFSFEDINGQTVSLSDFKGSYVFIDIWATWCAPCIAQIPALKELEEQYKDHNLAFVSISVDRKAAYTKWRDFVAKKQLGGSQLFADNSFDSVFIEAYGISSIPRFLLIDPKGDIVNAYAPKPSSDQAKAEIAALFN